MSDEPRPTGDVKDERRHVLLAAVDELDVVDDVLGSLHPLRRLISDEGVLDRFAPEDAGKDSPADPRCELIGVEDAVTELVRWRLRRVARAVRSMG